MARRDSLYILFLRDPTAASICAASKRMQTSGKQLSKFVGCDNKVVQTIMRRRKIIIKKTFSSSSTLVSYAVGNSHAEEAKKIIEWKKERRRSHSLHRESKTLKWTKERHSQFFQRTVFPWVISVLFSFCVNYSLSNALCYVDEANRQVYCSLRSSR